MSPPGAPKGIANLPGVIAIAGFGVRRGLFPGKISDACPLTANDWEPLEDGQNPRPGITGLSNDTSDGVMEHTLPVLSMAQVYEVSGAAIVSDLSTQASYGGLPNPGIIPAGGSLVQALPISIIVFLFSANSVDSKCFIGTSIILGSP